MNLKYYVKIILHCMKETKEFEFNSLYQVKDFLKKWEQSGRIFVIEMR